jgi:ubiquinone biosynthesis protein
VRALKLIPDLIRKIDASYPNPGGAPPPPPLPVVAVERGRWAPLIATALIAGAGGAAVAALLLG